MATPAGVVSLHQKDIRMRELTSAEVEATVGGLLPVVIAIALVLSGCSTTGRLRRGERTPDEKPH
jgi:hypothetical protein